MRTANSVAEELLDWKVDTIFGLHGDGINGFIEALRRRQAICQKDRINFIETKSIHTILTNKAVLSWKIIKWLST
ncbi:MAG: hypothetical protein ACJ701_01775 [Nitrososphaera sp.]